MQILLCFILFSFSLFAEPLATFPSDFLFGVASAPGHVEDSLDDTWMRFAEKDKIRAFHNVPFPEKRLEFWTHPEKEIREAQDLGIQIFRLGIDWGRVHLGPESFDEEAIQHYQKIISEIRSKNIKIMLTLFHFTVPKWLEDKGGWKSDEAIGAFLSFSKKVLSEFHPSVDFWITFNEPQIFSSMAYTLGIFPPGESSSFLSLLDLGFYEGSTVKVLKRMAKAHNELYVWAKKHLPENQIGISQHMGFHSGKNFLSKWISQFTGEFMNWYFPSLIEGRMDFFGFNYYGAEWVGLGNIEIVEDEEYSEAGRAVYPTGLYEVMMEIQKRYPGLPQFITENGISDATDWLRPSYLIEHLLAAKEAEKKGVQLLGYIFWTLTDNMEWADGYCPKFGLVEIDRNMMKRIRRPSFSLYQSIIQERQITRKERDESWNLVESHVGQERPFCRAEDGVTGLDIPSRRTIRSVNWKFSL